ncbi:family 43 glycosylhydrolase [Clostridium folliculivorans]|uniref:Alpha-N-arabinofuranosidase n=1 Tax=Clostridium folliculivorans TaxID=2886038 RepID=A0A9W5Y5S5_9CLOT|nr:family 43 glycosylhydrolase [Clostridium folliculivorans]GKU27008.1 hypothetical protein CFOLD11_38350 [Clostridium folliculivorans]GKU29150.1 hypothetical protein CFB3_12560 [Clostridium folliculivorans]
MERQVFNPYLPSHEYIPDGEPYVFEDRLYVFGSHDRFNGPFFCMNDYVCWSTPVDDLKDWKYEGIIYKKTQDPLNRKARHSLYAPDVARGLDGRYYLYYTVGFTGVMSVAVSDTPAGKYEFYGHVHFSNGRVWGKASGDVFPFDPGVLVDDDGRVYLYSGFAPKVPLPAIATGLKQHIMDGGYVIELEKDMVTIKREPKLIFNKVGKATGTGFENHEFFEASSIRKVRSKYYFIYSSVHNHELCYAVSDNPMGEFKYGGTIISNGDIFLKGNSDEKNAYNYIGNNHGSIVEVNKQWYVFYHRQTNKHSYSRQGCAEPISIEESDMIRQVEMTSCGLNREPLIGVGRYSTSIVCNLMSKNGTGRYDKLFSRLSLLSHPYITQKGRDREDNPNQYIANFRSGSIAGFKYFSVNSIKKIAIEIQGNAKGQVVIRSTLDCMEPVARIIINTCNKISKFESDIQLNDGKQALYFEFKGKGSFDFFTFELK